MGRHCLLRLSAIRVARGVRPRVEGKPRTPLSSRVATRVSWSPLPTAPKLQERLGMQGKSQAGPHRGGTRVPLARPRSGAALGSSRGSTVGKLRAPGSIRHTVRHGWAERRVRVLFVCDHWGARVEASSCLHVLCVCALSHAWIPVRPCAREHARAVWTRACACLCVPGVLRPGDAHGSGVPASVSLCTGANAGPTVGPVGPAPALRLSPYFGCLSKKKVGQEPRFRSLPACVWGSVPGCTARPDYNLSCLGDPRRGGVVLAQGPPRCLRPQR